jgi:protein involved in polysaccharide export with SLBB domain
MMHRTISLTAVVLFGGIALGQSVSVSVTGEVRKPGTLTLPRNSLSVLQALALAEGTTKSANAADAVIIRGNRPLPVNVKEIVRGRIPDVPLLDGDELRIPKRNEQYTPPTPPMSPDLRRLDAA